MALISSRSSSTTWMLMTLLIPCLCGFAIAATIVLSLISLYLPNHAVQLRRVKTCQICQISFVTMPFVVTGAAPVAVETADFNKDGNLDLAVANYIGSTTSILLGDGRGGFNQHNILSNGRNSGPNSVAIGDINRDNNMDVVVANLLTSGIGVFLGKGDGSFITQPGFSTGSLSTPWGVQLGDLNNDQILDLAVTISERNTLLIFLGRGDGSFNWIHILPTGVISRPFSLVINDLNRDNYLDIVVCNSDGNNIGVFMGDGAGNFADQKTYSTGSGPYTLVAADFNRDGILDIATANFLENSRSILLGNGDGSFGSQRTLSIGDGSMPYGIDSGDFNQDCLPDLVVANSGNDDIAVSIGLGNGSFQQVQTYSTGSNSFPNAVAVGDFNGDNRLDIVSANYVSGKVSIFLNTCS